VQYLDKTYVMGVLNVTPDSFSDGGEWNSLDASLQRVGEMISEGVDIIDIGGESTRPGAVPVSLKDELERVLPVITAIRKVYGQEICLSLDTYKSQVAAEGVAAGVNIINDVSGLRFDTQMAQVVASAGCQIIINHIFGKPQTMQTDLKSRMDVVADVIKDLEAGIETALFAGIHQENIIVDPGFGFGKTYEDNFQLLAGLPKIVALGYPVMAGLSRKKTTGIAIQKRLNLGVEPAATERLGSSVAAHVIAVQNGAHIIRVHDIKAHVQAIALVDEYIKETKL